MRRVVDVIAREKLIEKRHLSDSHLIGVEFVGGDRSHIIKVSQEEYICSGIKNNRGYSAKIKSTTIQGLLSGVTDVKNIYTFDTAKELGEWLIENL